MNIYPVTEFSLDSSVLLYPFFLTYKEDEDPER